MERLLEQEVYDVFPKLIRPKRVKSRAQFEYKLSIAGFSRLLHPEVLTLGQIAGHLIDKLRKTHGALLNRV